MSKDIDLPNLHAPLIPFCQLESYYIKDPNPDNAHCLHFEQQLFQKRERIDSEDIQIDVSSRPRKDTEVFAEGLPIQATIDAPISLSKAAQQGAAQNDLEEPHKSIFD